MPTLDLIGKKAVLNHHKQVSYRLLQCNANLSASGWLGRPVRDKSKAKAPSFTRRHLPRSPALPTPGFVW